MGGGAAYFNSTQDPAQTTNIYSSLDSSKKNELAQQLNAFQACVGKACPGHATYRLGLFETVCYLQATFFQVYMFAIDRACPRGSSGLSRSYAHMRKSTKLIDDLTLDPRLVF